MNPLVQFDLDTFRAIHLGMHRDWLDPIFWVISTSGLGWVQVLILLIVPLICSRKESVWKRISDPIYFAVPLILSIVVSGLVFVGIVKNLMNRDRPSNLWFAHPQEDVHSHSFPSGHTTTSFAIAFLLLYFTRKADRAWIGWVALLWAALVGFSRIYRGVHWPTDVFGGVFAGLATASLFYLLSLREPGNRPAD